MNRKCLGIFVGLLAPLAALAWEPTGHYYYGGFFNFALGDICNTADYPDTPGDCSGAAGNPDWAAEFTTALDRWNSQTNLFEFTTTPDPGSFPPGSCDPSNASSTFFLNDICGVAFGGSTLAVAQTWYFPDGYALHSDIIFNTAFTWGAYDDALANHPGVIDFRRVAVHEAGHVIGLDHATHTNSIMYFAIQNVTSPRPDDLNAILSIYGLLQSDVSIDTNGNAVQELVTLRSRHDESVRAEVRDASSGALLKTVSLLGADYWPLNGIVLPDQDGNGAPEVAALGIRKSDGRGVVEIRNLSGAEAPRMIWFGVDITPVKLIALNDADSNGVMELAVLGTRDFDLQGLVEIKNSFGPTLPHTVWLANLSFAPDLGLPLDITSVADADNNGVPEIAVLSVRFGDGRGYVEVKNASGATAPNTVWAMPGVTVKSVASVADASGNGVPEVAILSTRDSDSRILVEVKNARGATAPTTVWFAAGHHPYGLVALGDVDGNSVEEIAVLSRRSADGRILAEVKNASGATAPSSVWFSSGFEAAPSLTIVDDSDSNTVDEVAVLLSRPSDGRLMIEQRNARGTAAARSIWLSP